MTCCAAETMQLLPIWLGFAVVTGGGGGGDGDPVAMVSVQALDIARRLSGLTSLLVKRNGSSWVLNIFGLGWVGFAIQTRLHPAFGNMAWLWLGLL